VGEREGEGLPNQANLTMTDDSRSPSDGRGTDSGRNLDDVFDALSHRQRRQILSALLASNPRSEHELRPSADGPAAADRGDSRTVLRHVHLPSLAEAGFVDWDRSAATVRRGPRFHEVEPVLRLLVDHQDELPGEWV